MTAITSTANQSKTKRRWFQYSLRTFLVVTLLFAVWLGSVVQRARRQKQAIEGLLSPGGTISYQHEHAGPGGKPTDPRGPRWLRQLLGREYFDRAYSVGIVDPSDEQLALLADLPDVELLQIGVRRIEKGLAPLTRLSRLKILDIEGDCKLTDADMVSIGRIANLETLAISSAPVSDAGLVHLERLQHLKSLTLYNTQVTSKGIARLERAIPALEFGQDYFPSAPEEQSTTAKLIASGAMFQANPKGRIQEVLFSGLKTADYDLVPLYDLKELQGVSALGTKITSAGIQKLRQKFPKLRTDMPLAAAPEEATAVSQLQEAGVRLSCCPDGPVQCAEVWGPEIGDADIAPLAHLDRLTSIGLHDTSVSDAGLTPAVSAHTLSRVELCRGRFTDAAAAQLKDLPNLQNLRLEGFPLTDHGMRHLGSLHLKELEIIGTEVRGPGLAFLKDMRELEKLHLPSNLLGQGGLAHLPTLPMLKELVLDSTGIDDEDVKDLQKFFSLELLSLQNTSVSDAALRYLEGLASLKTLMLRNTRVTKEGVERLRQKLPACRISY